MKAIELISIPIPEKIIIQSLKLKTSLTEKLIMVMLDKKKVDNLVKQINKKGA